MVDDKSIKAFAVRKDITIRGCFGGRRRTSLGSKSRFRRRARSLLCCIELLLSQPAARTQNLVSAHKVKRSQMETASSALKKGRAVRVTAPGDQDWHAHTKEKRKPLPATCAHSATRDTCALCRSHWFQSIKTLRHYSRNSTIVRQGEPVHNIYFLRHGLVQVSHLMPSGKAVSDLIGPGDIIGIAWAVSNEAYAYTAIALEECEVEQADAGTFLKRLRSSPGVAMDMLRYLSRQTQRLLSLFYEAASKVPTEARLLNMLQEISRTCGVPMDGAVRINLPLPIQVLADRIGCSRQWASRLLGELEERGVLKRKGSWISLIRQHEADSR